MPAARDPVLHPIPLTDLPPAWATHLPVLRRHLHLWWRRAGRHDLPWATTDPYGVLVSEIMLQQTTVAVVKNRYLQWMARWPTSAALAVATDDEVEVAWEGLGYTVRARRLRDAARLLADTGLPRARAARLALPGVGPSTASALAAFVWGRREAIFDANVARIWGRWTGGDPAASAARERLWSLAQHALPQAPAAVRAWTQAQMDLGALVCTPRAPRCPECPWRDTCATRGAPRAAPAALRQHPPHRTVAVFAWDADGIGPVLERRPAGQWWGDLWTPPLVPQETWAPALVHAAAQWEQGGVWSPPDTLGHGVATISGRRIAWAIVPASAQGLRTPWGRVDRVPWPSALRKWQQGCPEKGDDGESAAA